MKKIIALILLVALYACKKDPGKSILIKDKLRVLKIDSTKQKNISSHDVTVAMLVLEASVFNDV